MNSVLFNFMSRLVSQEYYVNISCIKLPARDAQNNSRSSLYTGNILLKISDPEPSRSSSSFTTYTRRFNSPAGVHHRAAA